MPSPSRRRSARSTPSFMPANVGMLGPRSLRIAGAIALLPRICTAEKPAERKLRGVADAAPMSARHLREIAVTEFGKSSLQDMFSTREPTTVTAVTTIVEHNSTRGVDYPGCTINSFAAFFYLNQAAMSIVSSTNDCENEMDFGSETQRVCAADIFGVVQSFWNSAAYLSGLASQCSEVANVHAECSAIIFVFIGSLAELFQAATSLAQTCGLVNKPHVAVEEVSQNERRRLSGTRLNEALHAAAGHLPSGPTTTSAFAPARSLQALGINGFDVGWCFVNTGSAVTYLAQAGWLIELAAKDCEVQETQDEKAMCAADAACIVAAFGNVASYIGGAASLCSNTLDLRGLCTGDVGALANALAGLAAAGAVLQKTCGQGEPLTGGEFAQGPDQPEPEPNAEKQGALAAHAAGAVGAADVAVVKAEVTSGEALVKEVLPGANFV